MSSKAKKERLDTILLSRGFFETKSQAQAAIMAGKVKLDSKPVTKAGTQISPDAALNVEIETLPYVSRGGLKLEKALKFFNISVKDRICLDAGASTGGFTDCMLQSGAKKVYAVDVGYGQLAWKLRNDSRVVVIERTNIRHASVEEIYKDITDKDLFADIAVMDLSFISITKVLSNIKTLMNPEKQEIVALIKPQFEAGKGQVPKSGVIKDKNVHVNVIKYVTDFACTLSLFPVDLTYSPVKGPAGNIEYLVYLSNKQGEMNEEKIRMVVEEAYEQLSSG
ncbi:MAG: TlyA family RNA methyltransferase [Candidatus Gastranaerophilales bacterium]|nr:TlyA family RNA methyltransferase [Candidatus Gastranaerophilales bacterium]